MMHPKVRKPSPAGGANERKSPGLNSSTASARVVRPTAAGVPKSTTPTKLVSSTSRKSPLSLIPSGDARVAIHHGTAVPVPTNGSSSSAKNRRTPQMASSPSQSQIFQSLLLSESVNYPNESSGRLNRSTNRAAGGNDGGSSGATGTSTGASGEGPAAGEDFKDDWVLRVIVNQQKQDSISTSSNNSSTGNFAAIGGNTATASSGSGSGTGTGSGSGATPTSPFASGLHPPPPPPPLTLNLPASTDTDAGVVGGISNAFVNMRANDQMVAAALASKSTDGTEPTAPAPFAGIAADGVNLMQDGVSWDNDPEDTDSGSESDDNEIGRSSGRQRGNSNLSNYSQSVPTSSGRNGVSVVSGSEDEDDDDIVRHASANVVGGAGGGVHVNGFFYDHDDFLGSPSSTGSGGNKRGRARGVSPLRRSANSSGFVNTSYDAGDDGDIDEDDSASTSDGHDVDVDEEDDEDMNELELERLIAMGSTSNTGGIRIPSNGSSSAGTGTGANLSGSEQADGTRSLAHSGGTDCCYHMGTSYCQAHNCTQHNCMHIHGHLVRDSSTPGAGGIGYRAPGHANDALWLERSATNGQSSSGHCPAALLSAISSMWTATAAANAAAAANANGSNDGVSAEHDASTPPLLQSTPTHPVLAPVSVPASGAKPVGSSSSPALATDTGTPRTSSPGAPAAEAPAVLPDFMDLQQTYMMYVIAASYQAELARMISMNGSSAAQMDPASASANASANATAAAVAAAASSATNGLPPADLPSMAAFTAANIGRLQQAWQEKYGTPMPHPKQTAAAMYEFGQQHQQQLQQQLQQQQQQQQSQIQQQLAQQHQARLQSQSRTTPPPPAVATTTPTISNSGGSRLTKRRSKSGSFNFSVGTGGNTGSTNNPGTGGTHGPSIASPSGQPSSAHASTAGGRVFFSGSGSNGGPATSTRRPQSGHSSHRDSHRNQSHHQRNGTHGTGSGSGHGRQLHAHGRTHRNYHNEVVDPELNSYHAHSNHGHVNGSGSGSSSSATTPSSSVPVAAAIASAEIFSSSSSGGGGAFSATSSSVSASTTSVARSNAVQSRAELGVDKMIASIMCTKSPAGGAGTVGNTIATGSGSTGRTTHEAMVEGVRKTQSRKCTTSAPAARKDMLPSLSVPPPPPSDRGIRSPGSAFDDRSVGSQASYNSASGSTTSLSTQGSVFVAVPSKHRSSQHQHHHHHHHHHHHYHGSGGHAKPTVSSTAASIAATSTATPAATSGSGSTTSRKTFGTR